MLPNVLRLESLLWISIQYISNQVLCISRDKSWYVIIPRQNFLIQIGSIGIFKWQVATEESEENKYVGSWSYTIKAEDAEGNYLLQISTN